MTPQGPDRHLARTLMVIGPNNGLSPDLLPAAGAQAPEARRWQAWSDAADGTPGSNRTRTDRAVLDSPIRCATDGTDG